MKTQDAIDFFGGVKSLASELNIWPQAIYKWGEHVPKAKAYEIESKTNGKLKANAQKN